MERGLGVQRDIYMYIPMNINMVLQLHYKCMASVADMGSSRGGGGGHSQYILVGCAAAHPKRGGLRHGHNPKMGGGGVLGTGTSGKRGGGGGLKNWSCKKDNLSI